MKDFFERSKFSFARYDAYFNSVNTKGAFYLTINTFFVGLSITGLNWIQNKFVVTELTAFFICLFLLSCFSAIISTLLAINPFLKSGETYGKPKSIFYYGSVSEFSCSDFKSRFEEIDEKDLKDDICTQLHILAVGLKKKYRLLTISGSLILAEFVLLLPILMLLTINRK
ncbi:Pycsar system effector family protein [Mucilaginibacter kameinonensis]|uniref:Pycsar system effector family protein n=1 Tax=Mucilaginibacter kameinonensis TaxID=452286 RepID=UPI000EF75FF2|nr:Pycsar system effector family protein [Mucilaginibacter kameinonensis]